MRHPDKKMPNGPWFLAQADEEYPVRMPVIGDRAVTAEDLLPLRIGQPRLGTLDDCTVLPRHVIIQVR